MATRTVTGLILKPNGAPWKGAEVKFALTDDTFRLSPDESYPLVTIIATTNDAGQISTTLNCGLDKAYLVTMPDRETFTIMVPCGSATTLETLRSESYGIPVPGGGTMIGPTGPAGNTGPAGGPTGPVGRVGPGVVVLTRTFSTGTTDADPGNGTLRLNNATQNAATQSFIDLLDTAGVDQTALLDSLDDSTNPVKGHLRIEKQSDAAAYLLFTLTAVTSATGYRKLVATIAGSSAASPFANTDPVYVTFVRAGNVGDTGPAGPQGIQGIQGPVGPVDGPVASVDSEITLFSGTSGKVLKRATGTGYVKVASGVLQTPVATIPATDVTGLDTAVGAIRTVLIPGTTRIAATNASNSTYVTAITGTFVLPAGTWTCNVEMPATFTGNTGAAFEADARISAPATGSAHIVQGGGSSGRSSAFPGVVATGIVSDGVAATTFTGQFRRGSVAETIFLENASILAVCRRTA